MYKGKKAKTVMEPHLTAVECYLPYGITQCYWPPDASEHTPPRFTHPGGMEG